MQDELQLTHLSACWTMLTVEKALRSQVWTQYNQHTLLKIFRAYNWKTEYNKKFNLCSDLFFVTKLWNCIKCIGWTHTPDRIVMTFGFFFNFSSFFLSTIFFTPGKIWVKVFRQIFVFAIFKVLLLTKFFNNFLIFQTRILLHVMQFSWSR